LGHRVTDQSWNLGTGRSPKGLHAFCVPCIAGAQNLNHIELQNVELNC
jgi:hypothetical protein